MNEFKLYVTSGLAFFMTPTEIIRSNQITVTYQGEEPVDVVVNGKIHQMQNGAASVDINDLREGMNICEVLKNKITIPCEGISVRGGYPLPSGITNKSLMLAICEELKEKRELCQELQEKLDAVAVEEREEDLFSF